MTSHGRMAGQRLSGRHAHGASRRDARPACRDLGPYIHIDLEDPAAVAQQVGHIPKNAWSLVNPEVAKKAAQGRFVIAPRGVDGRVFLPVMCVCAV